MPGKLWVNGAWMLNRVKEVATACGFENPSQLAEAADLHHFTVGRLWHGIYLSPNAKTMGAIANACNTTISDVFPLVKDDNTK